MTKQTINVGTAANDGTGDFERDAWVKANANFKELYDKQATIPLASPIIIWDGDSKGVEARETMRWATGFLNLDVNFNGAVIAVGQSRSDAGSTPVLHLTNPTRMQTADTTIRAAVATGAPVDVSLRHFTNDTVDPRSILAFLRTYHANIRQAGARYLLLWAPDLQGVGDTAKWIALGNVFRKYAKENSHDTVYLESQDAWLDPDPANTSGRVVPYANTATTLRPYGSVLRDTLHSSPYGDFKKWPSVRNELLRIYRKRPYPTMALNNGYSARALDGNAIGAHNRMVSLGTTAASGVITNNGAGAVTGNYPASKLLDSSTIINPGTLGFAITVEELVINNDDGPIPRGRWWCPKITFSGQATAIDSYGARIVLKQLPFGLTPNIAAGAVLRGSAFVYFDNLVGFQSLSISGFANSLIGSVGLGTGLGQPSPAAVPIPDALTGAFRLDSNDYVNDTLRSTNNMDLTITMGSQGPVSGSIWLPLLTMYDVSTLA